MISITIGKPRSSKMLLETTFCGGSHPCQGYRKTSYNDWDWGLRSTGSSKFRQLEPDGANGEVLFPSISTFETPPYRRCDRCSTNGRQRRAAGPDHGAM